jgi:hypothetical protein
VSDARNREFLGWLGWPASRIAAELDPEDQARVMEALDRIRRGESVDLGGGTTIERDAPPGFTGYVIGSR